MTLINSNIHFVLLAGGNSSRFSPKTNKLLAKFKNKNLLVHNIEFLKQLKFKKITIIVNNLKEINFNIFDDLELIKGGKTRSESVMNALKKTKFKSRYVLIHDVARPLISEKLVKKIIKNLVEKNMIVLFLTVSVLILL